MLNHKWTVEEEDVLRSKYKQSDHSSRIIARELGLSREAVKCKANRMGLSSPNTRHPWSKKDELRLESLVGKYSASTIAVKLGRSVCAIVRRTSYLNISRRTRDGWFTQDDVCKILGVGHRWLQRHIESKELIASINGNRAWRITEKDLEMFIRKHPMDINGRNVDFLMIVDILAGVIREE